MSSHKVEIVPVEMTRHQNADSLSVIPVWGFSYVGRTTDWIGVKRAAFIPPDSTVDVRRPEFAFLADQAKADGRARIKARRLRGVVSYGLMVPVPDDTPLGEDWAERLDVQHFEPPLEHEKSGKAKFFMGGEATGGPSGVVTPKYDLDSFLRYHALFKQGEPVVISEKIDGASAKYLYHDGEFHCGSRTEWKREYPCYDHITVESLTAKGMVIEQAREVVEKLHSKPKRQNLWWEVFRKTPTLEKFCRDNPGVVVYGEVAGSVNCIKYQFPDGTRFFGFDILQDGRWMDTERALCWLENSLVPIVPVLNKSLIEVCECCWAGLTPIPYDFEYIKEIAEGPSFAPDAKPGTIREGVVISPLKERYDPRLGRVKLKIINPTYLEKYR